MLKGQKFLGCNVLLTSRPHAVEDIKKYFSYTVKICGFRKHHAKEFVSRSLKDETKADTVLEIHCVNAGDYTQKSDSLYSSPIILLFYCILANNEDIDLAKKDTTLGEIYTKVFRWVYKRFTVRKGITFSESGFFNLVKRVGKLAFEILQSASSFVERSKVARVFGKDAFESGFIIGHKDVRLLAEETADLLIAFPHESIKEYYIAFYFIITSNDLQGIVLQDFLWDRLKFFYRAPLLFRFFLSSI